MGCGDGQQEGRFSDIAPEKRRCLRPLPIAKADYRTCHGARFFNKLLDGLIGRDRVHTYQLYFNLVRPNSHKDHLSLWQIIERLATRINSSTTQGDTMYPGFPRIECFAHQSRDDHPRRSTHSKSLCHCGQGHVQSASRISQRSGGRERNEESQVISRDY